MSAARVVMRSMWRKASGKYALIVLGLWVLVSLISLVWTPYALLETDGFHAWASPMPRIRWEPMALAPTC